MPDAPRLAVVGGYGVGITMRVDSMPRAGETLSGGQLSIGPGGKASNQAIGASRLGAEVCLLTAIGANDLGVDARKLWHEEGVDDSGVVRAPGATMTGLILVEPSGENRILLANGVLDDLSRDDVDAFRASMRAADVLLVSLEMPLDTALYALQLAHEDGVTTVLNPAPAPNEPIPEAAWSSIDYVTPNRTELDVLLGGEFRGSSEEGAERLRDLTGATVVLTLGGEGSLIAAPDLVRSVPPTLASRVVDTTGAGDSFNAALAVALAERRPLVEAVSFAARAGAHAVGIAEVVPALPYRADLEETSPARRATERTS